MLAPIERDEDFDRETSLPGGWEIQTRGKGSTFRIYDPHDDGRLPIPDSPYLHDITEWLGTTLQAHPARAGRCDGCDRAG